ncbi:CidA/LrgA family protein [Rhodoplanes sp. TEM]|uniref:CidA/LrgA family protein n=1 Tax=Rhodoplanes tepidamans TaxID=200616 RepID=A0ABT5JHF4_RHOTP|nr:MULTISPECIES: CidA/LrgA family protein [Rhodoplanes]MDC7788933.1 CidA/LrgA family protein [Rhodoplanes tepidamans]MDC7987244.1 CidA/LrgA family protein [Rhodoplanes sp. TEM]MDQ0358626.1 holin-like protein [Rhodoplanes tepidamans]
MLQGFVILLGCQLLGEAFVRAFVLPVPGPVVGMVLLAVLMLARMPLPSEVGDVSGGLLKHLSLLFVPAGVGIVQHLGRVGDEGFRILIVLVLSTVVTLAVTAVVFAGVARLMGVAADRGEPETGAVEDEP